MRNDLNDGKVVILDGGLGTTLKDIFNQDVSGLLWSARIIDDSPQSIIDAHLAFLRAGAEVISTATYQCAFSTFERSGYDAPEAVRLMREAVRLANAARNTFVSELSAGDARGQEVKIALSLGSFGATLPHAQEFSGVYPPPYGPVLFSASEPALNINTFGNDGLCQKAEDESVERLMAFHMERLRLFAQDYETWASVDYLAFETVPLTREITAIRRAVAGLGSDMTKPWWISTVWPQGRFPEKSVGDSEHTSAVKVVAALLGDEQGAARPDGIGINCTLVEHLPSVLSDVSHAVDKSERLWLVIYPNGGDIYDESTKRWILNPDGRGERWAKKVVDIVKPFIVGDRRWRNLLLGGCCRTGPTEIGALAKEVTHDYCAKALL